MIEKAEPPALSIAGDPFSTNFPQTQRRDDRREHFSSSMIVVEQLQELHDNAKISKYRHFAGAERKLLYHRLCGWGVILIEIAIVVILLDVLAAHPNLTWLKILALLAAAFATALSATQNYFDFHKISAGHRNVANRYLEISKKCKRLIGEAGDLNLTPNNLWDALKALDVEYDTLNREAEAFPTARSDYKRALELVKKVDSP